MSRHPHPMQRRTGYRPAFPQHLPAAPRPAPKRGRPRGPATFDPREPVSRCDWKRMFQAATYRLARLAGLHGRSLYSLSDRDLMELARHARPGRRNAAGKARRLAAKLIRLRDGRPAPATA